jgi:hypothetical protein
MRHLLGLRDLERKSNFGSKHCVVGAVGISVPITLPWANVYIMLMQA